MKITFDNSAHTPTPFSLAAWQEGGDVRLADGKEVRELTFLGAAAPGYACLFGTVNGRPCAWNIDGTYAKDPVFNTIQNLIMAPKLIVGWVAVKIDPNDLSDHAVCQSSGFFKSKETLSGIYPMEHGWNVFRVTIEQ